MTGASPWSVKGISAEERELAKQAARRAGVPIGKWLSRQIREAAEIERAGRAGERSRAPADIPDGSRFGHHAGWRATGSGAAPVGAPAASPPAAGAAHGPTATAWRSALVAPPAAPGRPAPPTVDPARLREVERQVQELHDLEGRLAALERLERRVGAMAAELTGLGSRLEDSEKRLKTRLTGLSRAVEALDEQVGDLRSRPSGAGAAPIERAVMRLAERLQRIEELTLPAERPGERPGRGFFARLFRR